VRLSRSRNCLEKKLGWSPERVFAESWRYTSCSLVLFTPTGVAHPEVKKNKNTTRANEINLFFN
jgi:hypothetical protein